MFQTTPRNWTHLSVLFMWLKTRWFSLTPSRYPMAQLGWADHHWIIKSQNFLSWKGSTSVESNSHPHTGPPKTQSLCLRAVTHCSVITGRSGPWPLPWEPAPCSPPSGADPFSNAHPDAASCYSYSSFLSLCKKLLRMIPPCINHCSKPKFASSPTEQYCLFHNIFPLQSCTHLIMSIIALKRPWK